MRCRVLGPVEVVDGDGVPIELRGDRQRALLATLVVHAGEVVSADRLVEGVWDGDAPADPAAALQSQVSRLRRALGGDGAALITTRPGGYALAATTPIDAVEFDTHLSDAQQLRDTDPGRALAALDHALALWRGEPYADVATVPTVRPEAVRLAERRATAREERAALAIELGRAGEVVPDLERLAASSPDRERPHALLMRALYVEGRQTDALAVYRRYRERLAEELGLDPSPALQELEGAVLRQELDVPLAGNVSPHRADRSPPVADAVEQGGEVATELLVDRPPTRFVGREHDLAAVTAAIDAARVVTVTGPGGVGKSRLVLEVAADVAPRYADGVDVLELAVLAPAADVPAALASQLGLAYREGVPVVERLRQFLARQRRLLVLDNAEHQLDAVATLVEALVAGTAVDVLVTSREPLGVDGEHLWPLAPLEAESEAVELFLDRVPAADPSFDRDAPGVRELAVELCRRLDGIPLCLELAAARLRVLSLGEVVEALDDRFALLAGGRRTAEPRHRSLDALVQWSCDLLPDDERELFVSLSVFAGAFDLAGARAVATASSRPPARVEPSLWSLVDKSLVVRVPGSGDTRYRLLETLRDFGRRQLDADARDRVERAHARYVVDLAEELDRRSLGSDEPAAAAALDELLPELRSAHRWLLDHGEVGDALRLTAALFWWARCRMLGEVFSWATDLVERTWESEDPLVFTAVATAALGAWQRGDLDEGRRLAEAGCRRAVELGVVAPGCLDSLGDISLFEGDLVRSVEWYQQARRDAEELGDRRQVVLACCNAALATAYQGDLSTARRLAAEGRVLADDVPAPSIVGWAAYTEGEVELEQGDATRALSCLDAALDLARRAGDRFLLGVAGLSATTLRARQGDEESLPAFGELIEHWRRAGVWTQQWTTLRNLVVLLVRLERCDEAARLLGAVQRPGRSPDPYGPEAERLAAAVAVLRDRLGDDLDAALAAGASLDDDATVAWALEVVASSSDLDVS